MTISSTNSGTNAVAYCVIDLVTKKSTNKFIETNVCINVWLDYFVICFVLYIINAATLPLDSNIIQMYRRNNIMVTHPPLYNGE